MPESQPSAALLALAARWFADFADRVERAVSEWTSRSETPTAVTFTRQSQREISIAHRSVSTELRLEANRIRVITRRAEPIRNNMGAATLVVFREDADGLVALADGRPMALDRVVAHVVGPIVRQEPAS